MNLLRCVEWQSAVLWMTAVSVCCCYVNSALQLLISWQLPRWRVSGWRCLPAGTGPARRGFPAQPCTAAWTHSTHIHTCTFWYTAHSLTHSLDTRAYRKQNTLLYYVHIFQNSIRMWYVLNANCTIQQHANWTLVQSASASECVGACWHSWGFWHSQLGMCTPKHWNCLRILH